MRQFFFIILFLISFLCCTAQEKRYSFSVQNSQCATEFGTSIIPYIARIEYHVLSQGIRQVDSDEYTTDMKYGNPTLGGGSDMRFQFQRYDSKHKWYDTYSIGVANRRRTMQFFLKRPNYEVGKISQYDYFFIEREIFASIGRLKKINFFKTNKLSLYLGAEVGLGYSPTGFCYAIINQYTISELTTGSDGRILSVKGYTESITLDGKPYINFIVSVPIKLEYHYKPYLSIYAAGGKNYQILFPFDQAGRHRGIYGEAKKQTLFGVGITYHFGKNEATE